MKFGPSGWGWPIRVGGWPFCLGLWVGQLSVVIIIITCRNQKYDGGKQEERGRPLVSGLALPPWGVGVDNFVFIILMLITYFPKVEEKGRQGLALRVGVGPSLSGLKLALRGRVGFFGGRGLALM